MKLRGIWVCAFSLLASSFAWGAGPVITVKTVDESTMTGTLSAMKDEQLVLTSPNGTVSLVDIVEMTTKGGGAPANGTIRKLTGKVIGTEGSYQNEGHTRDLAFDGNLETYFDAPKSETAEAWVGLDLGSAKVITMIKYAPRADARHVKRIIGGKFQGSNTADFSSGVVDLFTVATQAPMRKLTSNEVTKTQAFRYVRYKASDPSCNIAEIEFWGKDAGAKSGAKPDASATTQAAKPWKIVMIGDDQLSASVAGWSDQKLSVQCPFAEGGSLGIPFDQVREAWCGTDEQIKQARAIAQEAGVEDAAFVAKEGGVVSVRGVVVGIDADALLFKFNDEQKRINLGKLVGIVLGGQANKRDDAFRQTVQLTSGDVVTGNWKTYDAGANQMGLETRWGAKLSVPMDQVTRLRSTNGRLVYVGDLKPAAVEQVPYFDRLLTYRVDKSLTGTPLKLSDGEYAHGIAVHSRCVLTYDVGGKYEEFKTKVGFQQPEGKIGQAVIRVLGDGKVLYEDLDARGDAKPVDVSVKVGGVTRLTLEVDFGKNEDTGDRVVWANARLLRAKK